MGESSPNSEKSNKAQKAESNFCTVLHNEETRRARRSGIASLIFALAGVICYICSSKAGFRLMILLQYASIIFFLSTVVLGIKSVIIWHGSKQPSLAKHFLTAAMITFLSGGLLFVLSICASFRPLISASYFILLIAAPALGIIGSIISFRSQRPVGRLFAILLILILSIPLMMGCRDFLVWSLSYLYAPPALTSDNLLAYNKCIRLANDHEQYKNLTLRHSHLFDGDKWIDMERSFSRDEIIETRQLSKILYDVRCIKFQRDNDMLLFYKAANSFTILSPTWPSFLPVGPDALYSLSGENPNEIDSEVVNAGKPFIKIAGDWYMSRSLMLTGPRMDIPTSVPKSLIDHSLRANGPNPGDGH